MPREAPRHRPEIRVFILDTPPRAEGYDVAMTHALGRLGLGLGVLVLLSACGGTVVEPGGSGGSTTTGTNTNTGTTTTTTTGPSCGDGCPPNSVCIWETGTCAPVCNPDTFMPCGTGLVCDQCATGSCADCENCVAACVPVKGSACDDHDDCAADEVCLYAAHTCAPKCGANDTCADPKLTCNTCATPSCPVCSSCLGACL